MGLQILPADIPPPARIRDDSAPPPLARDRTSRFDGYLNDARSAGEPKPAAQSQQAEHNDAEHTTDVDADGADAEIAPSEDQPEDTTDQQQPVVVAPAPVVIAPDVPNTAPDADKPQTQTAPAAQQQPNTPASDAAPEAKPAQPTVTELPQQAQTAGQQVNAIGQVAEPTVAEDTRTAATAERTAQSERTPTKTLSDQPQEVRELVDGPSQRPPKAAEQSRAANEQITIDQDRAASQSRAADQSRVEGEQVGPQQRGPQHPRSAAIQRQALASRPPNPPKDAAQPASDSATPLRVSVASPVRRPVTIKSGKGDGAAASFARFLVTAAGQTGSDSTSNATSPVTAGGIGQTAGHPASAVVANQAPVADLVADLLAARVDDAAAIKGAARVLNASGRSGKFEVTMRLDPPELGQLRLQIQMRQQGLSLRVNAQTHAVAKMIQSRLTELRDALALHGIRVDRSEVTVRPAASTQTDTQTSQDNGPSHHGDFNQPSPQHQSGGDQRDAPPHRTADQHLDDPKHPVQEIDGGPSRTDPAALTGLGAETGNAITPATELSVNLVA